MSDDEAAVEPAPSTDAVPPTSSRRRRVIVEWVVLIVVAVAISFLVRTYVVQTYFIPSKSMEPTLLVGDRIVVNKLAVEFGTIHTGDIMVFTAPPAVAIDCNDAVPVLVKRVIGLPGQHLFSVGTTIYVNGHALNQWWTHYATLGTPIASPSHPITVPENHYFMMGDNHANSCDSRTWGSVPRSDMIGKAFIRIWPLRRFGFL